MTQCGILGVVAFYSLTGPCTEGDLLYNLMVWGCCPPRWVPLALKIGWAGWFSHGCELDQASWLPQLRTERGWFKAKVTWLSEGWELDTGLKYWINKRYQRQALSVGGLIISSVPWAWTYSQSILVPEFAPFLRGMVLQPRSLVLGVIPRLD